MTVISYYGEGFNLIEKEINKDTKLNGFTVTEGHLDLNDRVGNDIKCIGRNVYKAKSFQDAVNFYRTKFDEYEEKSFDWKGHSAGALKFYWNNGKTDVLTYLKLNYNGHEINSFDFEELGF